MTSNFTWSIKTIILFISTWYLPFYTAVYKNNNSIPSGMLCNSKCVFVFPTTCIILLELYVYSMKFLLHILYLFMRFQKTAMILNSELSTHIFFIKSLKVSQHVLIISHYIWVPGSSIVCSTSDEMPWTYTIWHLLCGNVSGKTSKPQFLSS